MIKYGELSTKKDNINAFLKQLKKNVEFALKNYDVKDVYFHVISDGRDTDTKALYTFISKLEEKIKETGIGHIASICGRYYAMDRDKNWNRTKLYFSVMDD